MGEPAQHTAIIDPGVFRVRRLEAAAQSEPTAYASDEHRLAG